MIAVEHTVSLATFRATVTETLDRVNQTGAPEIITVDGEARGVLLSPAVYEALESSAQVSRDVAVIERSLRQIDAGEGQEVNAFFAEVRARLLAMKAARPAGRSA